jgi:hypothetical protein
VRSFRHTCEADLPASGWPEDKRTAGDALEENADLEDFDPYDSTHLFWEEILQLGFAFREIRREDVTEEEIQQLIEASDPVWNILIRIHAAGSARGATNYPSELRD